MRNTAQHDLNFEPTLTAVSSADGVSVVPLEADPTTGALLISGGTLLTTPFDYIGATYPSATTEVYVYKSGGSGGNTVATVTITYSDSTKAAITSVGRI